jgi:RNase H-fold protein (predicted Holliday junction resolvase)
MVLLEINAVEVVVDILMFIIPSIIVFAVAYYFVTKFLDDQRNTRLMEFKKEHSKQITPIKLQAYERLALFLDRISPDNLVVRLSKSGQSAGQLRQALIQTITDEFNHNISQQIYVSDQSWSMIKAVKEQIIGIVELSYKECDENESGPSLGKRILTKLMAEKQIPTQRAIELLKKEIEIIF